MRSLVEVKSISCGWGDKRWGTVGTSNWGSKHDPRGDRQDKCGNECSHTRHLEPLQVPEVLHSHLQDVGLFQLGVSWALKGQKETEIKFLLEKKIRGLYFRLFLNRMSPPHIFLERIHDEGLELAQALVDARTSPLLHDGFRRLNRENAYIHFLMLSWHLYLLKLIRPVKNCPHTFLLSDRVRGFSGVDSPLAGVAATADGEDRSREPAGIFTQPGHNK